MNADATVTTIDRWWDRLSRNWIIQRKDADGNQIGAAEYVGNKADAQRVVKILATKYPHAQIVAASTVQLPFDVTPEHRAQLKELSARTRHTQQALLREALADLLAKYNQREAAK